MKLINCLGHEFYSACYKLSSIILSSEFKPDILIGVKTGGTYVSKNVYDNIKTDYPDVKYCEVQIQRPVTIFMKYVNIKKIFTFTPNICLDWLRKITIWVHEFTYDNFNGNLKRIGDVSISEDIVNFIKNDNINILIIDDAVDSGQTFAIIRDYLKSINENVNIKYAVLTTTYKNPKVKVDYTLYRRTILRFPWAFDTFKFVKK